MSLSTKYIIMMRLVGILFLIGASFFRVDCCVQQGGSVTCDHLDVGALHVWFRNAPLRTTTIAVGLVTAGN